MSKQFKKGILLISGGIDSPVAGNMMIKQGMEVIGLHLSNEPFTNDEPEKKSIAALEKIKAEKLIVINISKFLAEIVKKCGHKFYYVLGKRLFYRIAEIIAEKEGCECIITGENMGQVSSQTLSNLSVIQKAAKMPVLQPLLTMDKSEIVNMAMETGTFEISKGPEMCSVLGPKSPATKTLLRIIEREESKVDYDDLMKECLKSERVLGFR